MVEQHLTDDLFCKLDEDYYDAHPDQWMEGPFYLHEEAFSLIALGQTDFYERKRRPKEKATPQYIKRGKRKIWEVGTAYIVKDHRYPLYSTSQDAHEVHGHTHTESYSVEIDNSHVLGVIRLVGISPGKGSDKLTFEKVHGKKTMTKI